MRWHGTVEIWKLCSAIGTPAVGAVDRYLFNIEEYLCAISAHQNPWNI